MRVARPLAMIRAADSVRVVVAKAKVKAIVRSSVTVVRAKIKIATSVVRPQRALPLRARVLRLLRLQARSPAVCLVG